MIDFYFPIEIECRNSPIFKLHPEINEMKREKTFDQFKILSEDNFCNPVGINFKWQKYWL